MFTKCAQNTCVLDLILVNVKMFLPKCSRDMHKICVPTVHLTKMFLNLSFKLWRDMKDFCQKIDLVPSRCTLAPQGRFVVWIGINYWACVLILIKRGITWSILRKRRSTAALSELRKFEPEYSQVSNGETLPLIQFTAHLNEARARFIP